MAANSPGGAFWRSSVQ